MARAQPTTIQQVETTTQPKPARRAAEREDFTKAYLDREARANHRPHKQRVVWDKREDGLCVLISRGPKDERQATVTFRVCFYLPSHPGKPHYLRIGSYPNDSYTYPYKDEKGRDIVIACANIDDVRDAARDARTRAKRGIDPRRPVELDVVADVVAKFLDLHARKNRSYDETERIFVRYVLPEWKNLRMGDIDKARVNALLDKIEKQQIVYRKDEKIVRNAQRKAVLLGSAKTATATLAQLSKLFNWHAARTDSFRSPVVKGMGRGKPKARARYLRDAELRVLWPLLDDVYGAVLKAALLTAQRFHTVSHMRRADLKQQLTVPGHLDADEVWVDDVVLDNVWDAGREGDPDNKQVSAVPLSAMALEVINSVPMVNAANGGDYVFSLNGREPIKGWSKYKARLDAAMQQALAAQGIAFEDWQHRDLRRTAKTLMGRAGVNRFISERCLAHVIKGVEGTYDRYEYLREKRDAFDRLAALVERVVHPPEGNNVVPMSARR